MERTLSLPSGHRRFDAWERYSAAATGLTPTPLAEPLAAAGRSWGGGRWAPVRTTLPN